MVKRTRDLLLILVIMALTVISPAYYPAVFPESRVYADDDQQSSFEYKYYSDSAEYREALSKKMNRVYKLMGGRINDNRSIPIPGIIRTYVRENGTVSSSKKYVPQGLCMAGDYMLVTAYDARKKHNSVIYIIDPLNNRLVSTLTLPHKYHVGGIAFDGENVWLTGNTSDKYTGEPFVQYISFGRCLELAVGPVSEISKNDMSHRVYVKNKPSFLEYDRGILWVGTYIGRKDTSEGYMNGYRIIEDSGRLKLNTVMYSMIAGLDSSVQGADIDGDYLYVSSSYKGSIQSVKSSFITKYYLPGVWNGSGNYYLDGKELSRVEVPKMNEEIIVEGETVHIMFESGADSWKSAVIRTDRILAVKRSLWGNYL